MPLLLLPTVSSFGLGGDTGTGEALATLENIELYLIPPSGSQSAAVRVETHALEIKLTQAALSQYILTVKTRLQTPISTSTYSGSTALESTWEAWIFQLWVRGQMVFDGPIEAWDIVWAGGKQAGQTWEDPGSELTLTALDWIPALLRRRCIETADGSQYAGSGVPAAIAADIINNAMGSTLITPTGWQTGSEVRSDLGPWTVTATGSGGTSTTWKAEAGDNVLDTVLEICNSAASEEDWLWPVATRSGTAISIRFLRGRTGAARQIGVDRTTAVSGMLGGGPISAERGNLTGYQQTGDRTQKENHLKATGKGRAGSGQLKRYKAAAGGSYGISEGFVNIPAAGTNQELDHEAQRIVNERATGHIQHKVRMREIAGALWPTHFGIGDTLPVYTPTGQTIELTATGIIWTLVAPGPATLEVTLGKWPRLAERDLGRSGGGGSGGGRGGGGRPRGKSGDSNTDPDNIKGFPTVTGQTGSAAVADAYDDTLDLAGYDTATFVRVKTHTANDPETVKDEILGTYVGAVITPTGHVVIRLDNGLTALLSAQLSGAP